MTGPDIVANINVTRCAEMMSFHRSPGPLRLDLGGDALFASTARMLPSFEMGFPRRLSSDGDLTKRTLQDRVTASQTLLVLVPIQMLLIYSFAVAYRLAEGACEGGGDHLVRTGAGLREEM